MKVAILDKGRNSLQKLKIALGGVISLQDILINIQEPLTIRNLLGANNACPYIAIKQANYTKIVIRIIL